MYVKALARETGSRAHSLGQGKHGQSGRALIHAKTSWPHAWHTACGPWLRPGQQQVQMHAWHQKLASNSCMCSCAATTSRQGQGALPRAWMYFGQLP